MKYICLFIPFFLLSLSANAQDAGYFQQDVHYAIDVQLNDQDHLLEGQLRLDYTNNAPQSLDTLYFHLWANAFKSPSTAFGQQMVQQHGDTEFYFAPEKDRGGYSRIDFLQADQPLRWNYHPEYQDIAILRLPTALESGASIQLQIPFSIKIPYCFSRFGRVGQSYQISQWYPKPAVYDREGWHPMPYLNMGEFYSEFGSFDVRITLPQNYVVGATGSLQTPEEQQFLDSLADRTRQMIQKNTLPQETDSITSSQHLKTIRFTAENVHDFAWFADKAFLYDRQEILAGNGQPVLSQVFFRPSEAELWQNACFYLGESTRFFSKCLSPYPYPQITAVSGAIEAGEAMEYPMITVVGEMPDGRSLDLTIAHEVAHNWLYGILGFNERDHPWLDEGLTSYYENRYERKNYSLPTPLSGEAASLDEQIYWRAARHHSDQAPATPSSDFTPLNYYLGAYVKAAKAFSHLESYLGTSQFDQLLQGFYQKWQFKHPAPQDLRTWLEQSSGKSLNWLFDDLIGSNKQLNYAIQSLNRNGEEVLVTLKNRGEIAAPIPLSAIKNDSVVFTQWHEGFTGEKQFVFPTGDFDWLVLDPYQVTLSGNRKNNQIRSSGWFPKVEPLQLALGFKPETPERTTLSWAPTTSWNAYDGWQFGLGLHNFSGSPHTVDFALFPFFATKTSTIAGEAQLFFNSYPKNGWFQHIRLGFSGKSFHFDQIAKDDYDLQFWRLVPSIRVKLRKTPASPFHQYLQWRTIVLGTESDIRDDQGNYLGNQWNQNLIHELAYSLENNLGLHPYRLDIALEQQHYDFFDQKARYLKVSVEGNYRFHYKHAKSLDIRLFAGGFLENTQRESGAIFPGAFYLTGEGFADYRFDNYYFGRSETDGLVSQQIAIRDGAVKLPLGAPNARSFASNNYILALNLKADFPFRLPWYFPLRPYFDIGYYDDATPTGANATLKDQLLWSGGLMLDFAEGIAGIHFPLFNSQNVNTILEQRGNYWTRISFHIDLLQLNPWRFEEALSNDRFRF